MVVRHFTEAPLRTFRKACPEFPSLGDGGVLRLSTRLPVTPKPHNGCQKFARRFGSDALCFVQNPATRSQNLRGIYLRVIASGIASPGAPIQVLFRPQLTEAS
jgi:MOSC domain-containing protein YiiM